MGGFFQGSEHQLGAAGDTQGRYRGLQLTIVGDTETWRTMDPVLAEEHIRLGRPFGEGVTGGQAVWSRGLLSQCRKWQREAAQGRALRVCAVRSVSAEPVGNPADVCTRPCWLGCGEWGPSPFLCRDPLGIW